MEHAGTAHAAVQEQHLPGAGARRVEDEPAGIHGGQSFEIALFYLLKRDEIIYVQLAVDGGVVDL